MTNESIMEACPQWIKLKFLDLRGIKSVRINLPRHFSFIIINSLILFRLKIIVSQLLSAAVIV